MTVGCSRPTGPRTNLVNSVVASQRCPWGVPRGTQSCGAVSGPVLLATGPRGDALPLHDALIDCGGQFHAGASHPQSYKAVLRPHEARHMIAIRRLFNPARGSVWHDGLSCASGIISAWRLARLPYIVMLAILPCMIQLCTLYDSGIESIIKPPITSNRTLTHSDYTQIRATCTKYRDHWVAGYRRPRR